LDVFKCKSKNLGDIGVEMKYSRRSKLQGDLVKKYDYIEEFVLKLFHTDARDFYLILV
jgi:hypothetical protein